MYQTKVDKACNKTVIDKRKQNMQRLSMEHPKTYMP